MNNIDTIKQLHTKVHKLMDLYCMHDENSGPSPYPENVYEGLLKDLDIIDVGWYKLNPNSDEAQQLVNSNLSMTFPRAKRLLVNRIKVIQSHITTKP